MQYQWPNDSRIFVQNEDTQEHKILAPRESQSFYSLEELFESIRAMERQTKFYPNRK